MKVPEDVGPGGAPPSPAPLPNLRGLVDATEARYSTEELAARTGLEAGLVRRLSRAMGFPELGPGETGFSDEDVEAFGGVAWVLREGLAEPTLVLQLARVMGQGLARMALTQAAALQERVADRVVPGEAGEQEAVEAVEAVDRLLPVLEGALVQAWRRHIVGAAAASNTQRQAAGDIAVGFGDLVGFTALSRELTTEALEGAVDRFEQMSFEVVGAGGGRVVKLIGDEVMFVADNPDAALGIALAFLDACDQDATLPSARVGVAYGPFVNISADYYGPTVNLASRLVAAAAPGTVLVSDELRRALSSTVPLWQLRGRLLKGVGLVPVWEFPAATRWSALGSLRAALNRLPIRPR